MHTSYLATRDHWPAKNLPKDLLAYFVSSQLSKSPGARVSIHTHQSFLRELDTNPSFAHFWKHIPEIYPDKSEYLAPLVNDRIPFEPEWIEQEYYRYHYGEELNKQSKRGQRKLQVEFNKIRPAAYQAALKGEAIRLNCNVAMVRPLDLVLPLEAKESEESRLVSMPDAIFLNVMNRLDTVDIFRVSLVCKRWKNVIYNNPGNLLRAEHAKTTHLITFTDWMDPAKTQPKITFEEKYHMFSLGLLKWCCRVNDHLETLILPRVVSLSELEPLLQSCPNLKNLQIGYENDSFFIKDDKPFCKGLHLPNLEFYSSYLYSFNCMSRFHTKILSSCASLRYFGGQLEISHISELEPRNQMQTAFRNLIALDLTQYTFHIMNILASIDDLKLRYFRVGYRDSFNLKFALNQEYYDPRDLLGVIGKLKKLEIFVATQKPGIGNRPIKALTKAKLNLKFGSFAEFLNPYYSFGRDEWDPDVLLEFSEMLLSNNPELDLSQFCFVVREDRVLQELKELNIGFTLCGVEELDDIHTYDFSLNDPRVKHRLGINF